MNPSPLYVVADDENLGLLAETIDHAAKHAVSIIQIRGQILDDLKKLAREIFAAHRVEVVLVRQPHDGVETDPLFNAVLESYAEQFPQEFAGYHLGAVLSCYNNQVEQRAAAALFWQRNGAGLGAQILGANEVHTLVPADGSSIDANSLASFLRELMLHSFGISTHRLLLIPCHKS